MTPAREARSAGVPPKISVVARVITTMKAVTRQSMERSRTISRTEVDMLASSSRLAHAANSTPSRLPAIASARFSMRSCRATCQRDAPSASLTANSLRRAAACVIDKCAMFRQAISNTNATTAMMMKRGWRNRCRSPPAPPEGLEVPSAAAASAKGRTNCGARAGTISGSRLLSNAVADCRLCDGFNRSMTNRR